MSQIELAPSVIEVPGRGLVNLEAMRVDHAVREYDERLRFGFNAANQDWVVYILLPRDYEGAPYIIEGNPAWPVLGMGRGRIPHPDEVTKRLYETDGLRHGSELLDKMNRENERLKAQAEAEKSEQMEEAAERIAHVLASEGKVQRTRFYMNGGKKRPGYQLGNKGE